MKAKLTKLESIAEIKVGYQARSKITDKADGTHWLIQGKDLDSLHQLQKDNLVKFVPERKPETYMVKKGDIILMARGAGNYASHIEEEIRDTLVAGSFYIIRIKAPSIIPAYLAWWLNQPTAQTYFQERSGGTYIPFISKNTLTQMQIKLPSLKVQQAVANAVKLWRQEQLLRERLLEARGRLVNAVCAKAGSERSK